MAAAVRPYYEALSIDELWAQAEEAFQKTTGVSLKSASSHGMATTMTKLDAKYGSGTTGGHAKSKRVVFNVLKVIENLGGLVFQAASTFFGPAQICFSAASFLLDIPARIDSVFGNVGALFEALEHYLTKLDIFKRVEKISKLDGELQQSIHVILVSFVDICGLAHRLAFGSKTSKFKAGTLAVLCHDDSGLSGALKQFNDLIEQQNGVVMALNLEHTLKIKEHTQQIPGIAAEVTAIRTVYAKNMETLVSDVETRSSEKSAEEQRAALIKMLEIPKDVMEEQERIVETMRYDCLPDSGLELQTNPDYLKWVDFNSDAKPTLFLSGDPRSGKSYLVHAMIDAINSGASQSSDNEKETSRSRVVVARYHFEKPDDRATNASTKVRNRTERPLETALKYMCFQIAQQHKGYSKDLATLLKEFRPRGKPFEDLWTNLMLEHPRGDVVHLIVFDGLDQIPEEDSAALLQIVGMQQILSGSTMTTFPNRSKIRILVSSTPRLFDSFPAGKFTGIPILDATSMNKSNIRLLIEQELESNKTWQENSENTKTLTAYIREELPDRSNGDFGIAMQALNSVRKAVEEGEGIKSVKMTLRNACEQDPGTIAAEAIDSLSKSLSILDIQRLNNLLMWVMYSGVRFDLKELRAIAYLESRDDPCQFETLIKSKYSRIFSIHPDGMVDIRAEIENFFENRPDERGKSSQGGTTTGPKISMEIKINNASVTEVKRFLWNLNERANLDGFFSIGTDAQVKDRTIDVYELDSYLHVSGKLLELLNDEFEEITEPLFMYAILNIHGLLRVLYARKVVLEPEEIKGILSGIITFLTDIDIFDQHVFSASSVWQIWLTDEANRPEHILRQWLTFSDGIKLLDRKDQRRLRKLMKPEYGYLSFYRPLAMFMAKLWLEGAVDSSFEAFCFILKYLESEKSWATSQLTQIDSARSRSSSVSVTSAIESPDTEKDIGDKARVDLVVKWMKDNLEHWQENDIWYERLGHTYLRLRLYRWAINAFEAGKLLSKRNPQLYWGCARAYAQQGNIGEAIEEQLTGLRLVESVSDVKPADVPTYLPNIRRLVIWYIDGQQFEKAIEEASAALQTMPFEYNLHCSVLEAARQSDNQTLIRDHFTTTLAELGEDGHSIKLTGLLEFVVDMFQKEQDVWSIEKIVVSARDAGTVPAVLESLRYLSSSKRKSWFLSTCRLFESFILASSIFRLEPDSLQRSIELAECLVEDEQNLAEFKKSDKTMALIFREAHQHLADIYFSQLMALKADGNGREQILTKMQDVINLSKTKMAKLQPYGLSHLAAYHAISGDREKAKSLLRPFLEEALDLLVDDSPENDPDAFLDLALCLGYFQDEYNSLNAWSLLAPYDGEGDDDIEVAEASVQLDSGINKSKSSGTGGVEDDKPVDSAENGSITTDAATKSIAEAITTAGTDTQRQDSNGDVDVGLTGRADVGSDPKATRPSVAIEEPTNLDDENQKNSSPLLETPSLNEDEFREQTAERLEKKRYLREIKLQMTRVKLEKEAYRFRILLLEKEREAKKEAEFEEQLRKRAFENGLSEDIVEKMLDRAKIQKEQSEELEDDRQEDDEDLDPDRPTWIRIATKYVLPETLDYYKLHWEYEDLKYEDDGREFIIIKEYISHEIQRAIFQHTKRLIKRRKHPHVIMKCTGECGMEWRYANDIYVCKICRDVFLCKKCLDTVKDHNRRWMRVCSPEHDWLHVPKWSKQRYTEVGKDNVLVGGAIGEDGHIVGGKVVGFQEWLSDIRREWDLTPVEAQTSHGQISHAWLTATADKLLPTSTLPCEEYPNDAQVSRMGIRSILIQSTGSSTRTALMSSNPLGMLAVSKAPDIDPVGTSGVLYTGGTPAIVGTVGTATRPERAIILVDPETRHSAKPSLSAPSPASMLAPLDLEATSNPSHRTNHNLPIVN